MQVRYGWTALVVGSLVASLAAGPALAQQPMYWKKIDLIETMGGEPESVDARLVVDAGKKAILVADEDNPMITYREIPYGAVSGITYSRSEHPRWKEGGGAALAVGIFAIPIFFMKGKKHWLTISFQGLEKHPEGMVYLRLDKNNFMQIISVLEAQTGKTVERIIED